MATTVAPTSSYADCAAQLHARLVAQLDHDVEQDPRMDDLSIRLRREALDTMQDEPELTMLLRNTVLADGVVTFDDAVAQTITYRMLLQPACKNPQQQQQAMATTTSTTGMFCPYSLRGIIARALESPYQEAGHVMAEAIRQDVLAVIDRDPACDSVLEVVLFSKGYAALVCHRAAHRQWKTRAKKSMTALFLQSQASAMFGLDIHPGATVGAGILLDHGTGIVIGETAYVGDRCTLLHGVTLGGTGKDTGDRHPKVGNDVLIGANASILGAIKIGDAAKIGAGSIVLGPIPSGATAVGAPAKIIGRNTDSQPGSNMDEMLHKVKRNHLSSVTQQANNNNGIGSSSMSRTDSNTASLTDSTESSLPSEDDEEEEGDKVIAQGDEQPQSTSLGMARLRKNSSVFTKRLQHCCPFRDYTALSKKILPRGSITICDLRKLLEQEGCRDDSELGEVFFALDENSQGYIQPGQMKAPRCVEILKRYTSLSQEQIASAVEKWEKKDASSSCSSSTN